MTIEGDLRLRLAAAIRDGDAAEQRRIRELLDAAAGPKAGKETRYEVQVTEVQEDDTDVEKETR
jgi:hypothetical protein